MIRRLDGSWIATDAEKRQFDVMMRRHGRTMFQELPTPPGTIGAPPSPPDTIPVDAPKDPASVEAKGMDKADFLEGIGAGDELNDYPGIGWIYKKSPPFDRGAPAGVTVPTSGTDVTCWIKGTFVIASMRAKTGVCADMFAVEGAARDDWRKEGSTNYAGKLNGYQDTITTAWSSGDRKLKDDLKDYVSEDSLYSTFLTFLLDGLQAVVGDKATGPCTACTTCTPADNIKSKLQTAVTNAATRLGQYVTSLAGNADAKAAALREKTATRMAYIVDGEDAVALQEYLRICERHINDVYPFSKCMQEGRIENCEETEKVRAGECCYVGTAQQLSMQSMIAKYDEACGKASTSTATTTQRNTKDTEACNSLYLIVDQLRSYMRIIEKTSFYERGESAKSAMLLPAQPGQDTMLASVDSLKRLGLNTDIVARFSANNQEQLSGIGTISYPHKSCRDRYMICFNNICHFAAVDPAIGIPGKPMVGKLVGVPLMSVGDKTVKGIAFTRQDFAQMGKSHTKLNSIITAPMKLAPTKLGHNNRLVRGDENYSLAFDKGRPALGWIDKVYPHPKNPDILLGDIIGIPYRLHKFLALGKESPFRRESIEVVSDFIDSDGETHAKLIVGIALLGEDIPFEINLDSLEKWELLYYPEGAEHTSATTTKLPPSTGVGFNVDRVQFAPPAKKPCSGCGKGAPPAPSTTTTLSQRLRQDMTQFSGAIDSGKAKLLSDIRMSLREKDLKRWLEAGVLNPQNIEHMRRLLFSADPFIKDPRYQVKQGEKGVLLKRILDNEVALVQYVE